jgi:hypothetical protein
MQGSDKIPADRSGTGYYVAPPDTSAELAGLIGDESGTGPVVFGTGPTLTGVTFSGQWALPDDVRQTFNPGTTNAGLNVGSHAGDPSSPTNGDLWYDSTANELTARVNGSNVALGAGGGGLASGDIDTSAELRAILTDESGTGAALFAGGDIAAGTATTPAANDNDTSVATTAYVQGELTAYASDSVTLTNKTLDADDNTLQDFPVEIGAALSDESTDLAAGTAKLTLRAPFAFTLTGVRVSVNTAPAGSTVIVDVNEAGSTVLSTKASIDAGEETSTTAASAPVVSDSSVADDAELTFDIDQVGSSTPGKGLKVWLLGKRTF